MAYFKDDYSREGTTVSLDRHDVCKDVNKSLADDQKAYEEKLYNLLLDELLRSGEAFSA